MCRSIRSKPYTSNCFLFSDNIPADSAFWLSCLQGVQCVGDYLLLSKSEYSSAAYGPDGPMG